MSTIFDEPIETYHADPALGSGDIRAYGRASQLFKDTVDGICDKETDSMLFGSASHLSMLEPEKFIERVAVKPEGMNFSTIEGKAWRKAHSDRIIITAENAAHLMRMHQRMPAPVCEIFAACKKEVTVRTELDGLPVQCRPDLWNIEAKRFYDLKTIGAIEDIEISIWKRGYHVQLEWYRRVLFAETGIKHDSRLIFVETKPPYRWRICDLDPDYRAIAVEAVDEALHGIRARMKSGCWSDDGDIEEVVAPPRWAEGLIPEFADADADEEI